MNFTIDPSFICSVTISQSGSIFSENQKLTDDELMRVLKGTDRWTSHRSDDHPEFQKLRNELEEKGFIHTERQFWNGDCVLKEFTLNGAIFEKNERFPCASALTFIINRKIRDQKLK